MSICNKHGSAITSFLNIPNIICKKLYFFFKKVNGELYTWGTGNFGELGSKQI